MVIAPVGVPYCDIVRVTAGEYVVVEVVAVLASIVLTSIPGSIPSLAVCRRVFGRDDFSLAILWAKVREPKSICVQEIHNHEPKDNCQSVPSKIRNDNG